MLAEEQPATEAAHGTAHCADKVEGETPKDGSKVADGMVDCFADQWLIILWTEGSIVTTKLY